MGKKSLLAPTSKENISGGKGEEKEKKPLTAAGTPKKAAKKSATRKAPAAAAAKKKATGVKTAKKGAASKKSSRKKTAPSSKTTTAKSSTKPKAKKKAAAKKKPAMPEAEATPRTFGQTDSRRTAAPASTTQTVEVVQEEKESRDPLQKMAVIGLAVLAVLLIMVLWTSASNVGKFYVKPGDDGRLEVWKGRFSPKGVDKIFELRNASVTAELKEVYSKEEAYAIIFEGVIADADALLTTEEMPDFEVIRSTLATAQPFAVSKEMSQRLQRRLDKIDMMALVYKADILAGRGTVEDLTRARESLERAIRLNLDEAEKGLIRQKINWVDLKLSEIAEE